MLMKYEAIVVFDSNLDDEALKQQVERIDAIVRNHGGELESKDFWGRRALAYPIKKKQYGNFVMLTLTGDNTLVADLRRQLKINDTVLRSFIVKKDKHARRIWFSEFGMIMPHLKWDFRMDGGTVVWGIWMS